MQRDFFDFLVFVGAKQIIGTQGSTFGKYATIFGKSKFIDVGFKPSPDELLSYFAQEVACDLSASEDIIERTKSALLSLNEQRAAGLLS